MQLKLKISLEMTDHVSQYLWSVKLNKKTIRYL